MMKIRHIGCPCSWRRFHSVALGVNCAYTREHERRDLPHSAIDALSLAGWGQQSVLSSVT